MAVVEEFDAVEVDDAEVGRDGFEFVDVEDFVDFFFFFGDFFVGAWRERMSRAGWELSKKLRVLPQ